MILRMNERTNTQTNERTNETATAPHTRTHNRLRNVRASQPHATSSRPPLHTTVEEAQALCISRSAWVLSGKGRRNCHRNPKRQDKNDGRNNTITQSTNNRSRGQNIETASRPEHPPYNSANNTCVGAGCGSPNEPLQQAACRSRSTRRSRATVG